MALGSPSSAAPETGTYAGDLPGMAGGAEKSLPPRSFLPGKIPPPLPTSCKTRFRRPWELLCFPFHHLHYHHHHPTPAFLSSLLRPPNPHPILTRSSEYMLAKSPSRPRRIREGFLFYLSGCYSEFAPPARTKIRALVQDREVVRRHLTVPRKRNRLLALPPAVHASHLKFVKCIPVRENFRSKAI